MATVTGLHSTQSVARGLLDKYYARVDNLLEYILKLVPGFSVESSAIDPTSSEIPHDLQNLLVSTLVGYHEFSPSTHFQSLPTEMSQEEVSKPGAWR